MSDIVKDDSKNGSDNRASNNNVFDTILGLSSNSYHVFIVRKSERLASALYVITGFMPQEEPIRTRLRVCALEIISHSASPYDLVENGTKKFESRCAEIITILQTARYSGLISDMNAKLVGEEYASLSVFVTTHAGKIAERGHLLEKTSVSGPKGLPGPIRHKEKSLLRNSEISKRTNSPRENNSADYRKSLILKLFDKKDAISIKDAVSFIPGISEKTVQRDILALVASGTLTKNGSRRWTIYRKAASQTVS